MQREVQVCGAMETGCRSFSLEWDGKTLMGFFTSGQLGRTVPKSQFADLLVWDGKGPVGVPHPAESHLWMELGFTGRGWKHPVLEAGGIPRWEADGMAGCEAQPVLPSGCSGALGL